MRNNSFTPHLQLLARTVLLSSLFLLIMSLFRTALFLLFKPAEIPAVYRGDLFDAFLLGFRLDLSVVAYLLVLPLLALIAARIVPNFLSLQLLQRAFGLYFIVFFALVSFLLISDIAFFSYFSEHITLMIFGVFDDDTAALWATAKENYNMPLLALGGAAYLLLLGWLVRKTLTLPLLKREVFWPPLWQGFFFVLLVALLALAMRGSVGMYPISKMVADISADPFINKLPQNGVHAMIRAQKDYRRSKSGNYDLIKDAGYAGRINEAFEAYLGKALPKGSDLKASLVRTTAPNEALSAMPPHVVVVMVESFGMPILAHQSADFDIMGRLKRHFEEDSVFENFISASNGTIVSLEPLLLNITARPRSTAFGQSEYMGTAFEQASARVYQNAGYETSFVYGGDLSWRNVGSFFARQGFAHVEGKANILSALGLDAQSACHDWGVFDEHSYDFVLQKLQNATSPQFIFLLTTNNHPPYRIPPSYTSRPLEWSDALREQVTGDAALAARRFKDYGYALDMAGRFLDTLKSSALREKTVVAITGDNNTIEGIMHYEDTISQSKRIPFYLYAPASLRPKQLDTAQPGSHKDIFPTLYNLTLSDTSYIAVGTDLLDEEVLHCGFNDAGVIVSKEGAFKKGMPQNSAQKACDDYYRATLAVTEYLIRSARDKEKLTLER